MPLSVRHLNLVVPGANRLRARPRKLPPVFCKLAKYRCATPRAYDWKCIAKLSHKGPLCVFDVTNPHEYVIWLSPHSVCDRTKRFGSALPFSVLLELFRINTKIDALGHKPPWLEIRQWAPEIWYSGVIKQAHYFHLNLPLSNIMRSNGRKLLMFSEPLGEQHLLNTPPQWKNIPKYFSRMPG